MTEEKFREIYHQYYQLVKRVVYSVLHDADFSEDVCQEVFILFSEKADSMKEEHYRQWFLVNAKRKAIDFCRKSYQVHEITTAVPVPGEENFSEKLSESYSGKGRTRFEDEVAHAIMLKDFTGRLFEDLAKKNSDWYEIVIRTHLEGEKPEDTARALGISIENLRTKKHRIKNWINEHYRKEYEGA